MKSIARFMLIAAAVVLISLPIPARADSAPTHYVLRRPLSSGAYQFATLGYTYGGTREGSSVHHGVDFENSSGTSILAAGDGTVYYAGSDQERAFGPQTNFYGNLVVIQHDVAAPEGGPLFTLYGHMNRVLVKTGQRVTSGQRIGTVGATGIAIGPHLHFEVRVGNPDDYFAVRNPELWYPPRPGTGRLIGRVLDQSGGFAVGLRYTLTTGSKILPGWTYADPALRSDPTYNENFQISDVLAGCYSLRVKLANNQFGYDDSICIRAGQTVFVEIRLK